jgi:hypothetical protein
MDRMGREREEGERVEDRGREIRREGEGIVRKKEKERANKRRQNKDGVKKER